MDQKNSDTSNRPILKLKPSKKPDIADKVNLQLNPTAKNNKKEQSLEQDADQAGNTEIKADTETSQSSEQINPLLIHKILKRLKRTTLVTRQTYRRLRRKNIAWSLSFIIKL